MYLKRNRRLKDGKEHFYWNVVESKRCAGARSYSGKFSISARSTTANESMCRVIEAFDEDSQQATQLALFSADERS